MERVTGATGKDAMNFQYWSFVVSLVVQVATLVLSIVTLAEYHPPPVLRLVLVLETVVQAVEFAWYLVVGVAYQYFDHSTGTNSRYFDWVITTPTMLISLLFLIFYYHDECISVASMTQSEYFGSLLLVIIIADWGMLLCGAVSRNRNYNRGGTAYNETLEGALSQKNRRREPCWLVAGFVALIVSFVPHLSTLSGRYSAEAMWLIAATFGVWVLYGLVEVWQYVEERAQLKASLLDRDRGCDTVALHDGRPKTAALQNALYSVLKLHDGRLKTAALQNALYNVLDILAKNLTGIFVAVVALGYDKDTC